jgi:ATP-dependent RNA helicase DHX29
VVVVPTQLDTVTVSLTPRVTTFTMESIATPTLLQSEAYISTVALFITFSPSPKEEKCHLRLPGVWRQVWLELLAIKKHQDDTEDKRTLRNIRNIVQSGLHQAGGIKESSSTTHVPQILKEDSQKASSNPLVPPPPNSDPLRTVWYRKTSSSTYRQMLSTRSKLPIWIFKNEILETMGRHQAIIICGETGCGKSTQVPAFILENEMMAGRDCRIYITEPRRISAISLALRVAEELGESKRDIGSRQSDVGYAIRLESKVNNQTRIVYA